MSALDLPVCLSVNAPCALLECRVCLWSTLLSAMVRCGSARSLHLRKKLLCCDSGSQCSCESLCLSLADHMLANHFYLMKRSCDKNVAKVEQNRWEYWEGSVPSPDLYSSVKTLLISCISIPWSFSCRQWFLSDHSFHAIIQICLCRVAIQLLGDASDLIWSRYDWWSVYRCLLIIRWNILLMEECEASPVSTLGFIVSVKMVLN